MKAGSKVVIHGYPGYTSYKLNDGEPIEDEYYTFIALEDMVLTVTPVSGNNYFYSIEVTLHTGLTLVDAKDPTCTEAGYNAHYVCDCHGELTDKGEIAVLAHDYKYDVCSGCGAIDPAYADVTHRINFSTWEKFDKETYADGTVVKYNDIFSFIYSKNAKVDESSKTWDDFAGTLRFSFGSKTPTGKIPNKAAMQITVDGAYTIKLWYVAGGDARYFALLDSTGTVISETTKETVKNGQYYAELIIPAAGTYYLGTPADNNYLFQIELVKHEHTAGAEATCTTAQTCTTCGAVLVAALGHDYEASVTAPTCTEAGYTTYTCACGDTYTGDEVAALGHNYEAVVTAPTCTEAGYTTYTCACGDTYTEVGEAALGHTAGAEATCTTAQTCTTCGAELVAALGHVEHALAMVAPTCTETGLTRGSQCLECGEILAAQEEIPATGHTFVEGKCECGAEDPDYVPEQSSVEEPSIFATIWAKIVAFFASIIGFFKNLFA